VSASRTRTGLAVALLAVAGVMGARAVMKVQRESRGFEACEAVAAGDWAAALATSERLDPGHPDDRLGVECRCIALMAQGRGGDCIELIGAPLRAAGDDWTPPPVLAVPLAEHWRTQGHLTPAAELLARAGEEWPQDPSLISAELLIRREVEGEDAVLADLEARLARQRDHATNLRVRLAHARRHRNEPDKALAVLGQQPPPADSPARDGWYEARVRALAQKADIPGIQGVCRSWEAAGGNPARVLAYYGATLSESGLHDPAISITELLARGIAAGEAIDDETLHEYLYHRLVAHLVVDGQHERALALYDQGRERFELEGLSRDSITLSQLQVELSDGRRPLEQGVLSFEVQAPLPGARLLVSPGTEAALDAPFVALNLEEDRRGTVERAMSTAPERWVYQDAQGHTRASGTAWAFPGSTATVRVVPGEPQRPRDFELVRAPADGRERLFVVVVDCMDWNMASYLRARGELPVFGMLMEQGWRAVLDSNPPFTSTAMDFLVHPAQGHKASVLGMVHDIGGELVDMVPSGKNPFAPLYWLMRDEASLFETIGAGSHSVANLLFSHGVTDMGRHGEVLGPHGAVGEPLSFPAFRPLSADEKAQHPGLATAPTPYFGQLVQESAAMFDAAERVAERREIEALVMRIVPMDRMSHARFMAATASGQDDAQDFLFHFYRYVDARVGALWSALDQDDTIVLMSDHGIRTAMEHDRPAIFLVHGPGVPQGRAEGNPHLRGASRVFAALLGIDTGWPDTGIAIWATDAPEQQAR
jgi:hypothetical protein